MARKSLEEIMGQVNAAHEKNASLAAKPGEINQSRLQALAAEMEKEAAGAGPAGGSLPSSGAIPAGNMIQQAPQAAAASEAVVTTQVALAGGNPAEQAAGQIPAQTKPNIGIIATDLAGTAKKPEDLNKTPEAIAQSQQPTAKIAAAPVAIVAPHQTIEKTAELQRAQEIGAAMAQAFIVGLEKEASDQEYHEAVEFLQSRGILGNYQFNA